MLEATRTFIAADGSRISKGRSRVAEGSELALAHPGSFDHVQGSGRGGRMRTYTSTEPESATVAGVQAIMDAPLPASLGLERWRIFTGSPECVFHPDTIAAEIRFAKLAHDQAVAILRATTERDGLEAGGLLLGQVDKQPFEVVMVAGHGPNARREVSGFAPDVETDLAVADKVRTDSGGSVRAVGTWHSHRQWHAPSPDDLRAFNCWRGLLELDTMVTLIALPTREGWTFEGFVTEGGFSRDTCSRARLIELPPDLAA
jgi:hypothetical protein